MASGSKDYWVTVDNWMYSLLTIVKDAVKENGLIQTALDSMDGKLDGFIDLGALTEAQTVYLAKMFLTDTVDSDGKNLLTKLDAVDGKTDGKMDLTSLNADTVTAIARLLDIKTSVETGGNLINKLDNLDGKADGKLDLTSLNADTVTAIARLLDIKTSVETGGNLIAKLDNLDGVADGRLDLSKLQTFDIFYDSAAGKSRLEISIEKLVLVVTELTGVHTDTTSMVAFGSEDWAGTYTISGWSLISDINTKRNMLRIWVSHLTDYSRDNGVSIAGRITGDSTTIFHDAPGVWLKKVASGSADFTAYEEWAT